MGKDIEGLAKIGEEVILKHLSTKVKFMEYMFEWKEKHPNSSWKKDFREGSLFYREAREQAVNLSLEVSEYDEKFSRAIQRYIEITGEKDIAELTNKETKIRNSLEDGSSEEYIKFLREQKE